MGEAGGKRHRVLKGALIASSGLVGLIVVVIVAVIVAITIPSVQQKAAQAASRILSEKTGIEVSVGHFSVKPPFNILLKEVFVGGGQADTLAFVGLMDIRLGIEELPDSVAVRGVKIYDVVAHTGSLIPDMGVDGKIGCLTARADAFELAGGCFRISDAVLKDADVILRLEDSGEKDTSSVSMPLLIDLENATLENVAFCLQPMALGLDVGKALTSTRLDIGGSRYTVRSIDLVDTDFGIGDFGLRVGRLCGDADVDLGQSLISSDMLEFSVPQLQAEACLRGTSFNLADMHVTTKAGGNFAGSDFSLDAGYDIDDEIFKGELDFSRLDLAPVLGMEGKELVLSGRLCTSGTGIDPFDSEMKADVSASLDSCRFDGIDISGVRLSAKLEEGTLSGDISSPVRYSGGDVEAGLTLESRFSLSDFAGKYPEMDLEARLGTIKARIIDDSLDISRMSLAFKTLKDLCDVRVDMPGIAFSADIPAHVLEIPSLVPAFSVGAGTLSGIDSLIAAVPALNLDIEISQDNPLRGFMQKRGFDLKRLAVALCSEGRARTLDLSVETPATGGEYRLPAMDASLYAHLDGDKADAKLSFTSEVKDGLLSVRGIDTGLEMKAVLKREGEDLRMDGALQLEDLVYDGKEIGDRTVVFNLCPDSENPGRFMAGANLDDIPVELVNQFVAIPQDIALSGKIRTRARLSGIPDKVRLFAGVQPLDAGVKYLPYDVNLKLGEQEITLEDDRLCLNGLSVIGADSTGIAFDGGMDLNTMVLDVSMKSDGFEPVELPQNGPVPVYGKLLAGIDGRISGPVDSLVAAIDVNILPQTDITYPIDKKNLVQVSPSGTVSLGFDTKEGLRLGGRLDVTEGKLFYSPKLYPMMPFSIDRDSHIRFNGAIEDTEFAISASQGTKAAYKPQGGVSKIVDFITGVKVSGSLKEPSIGFYLDAPKDKDIQKELEVTAEEDREGLAAVLLATGMYVSENNELTQTGGYALSSILQSKLNAVTSNNIGKVVDVNFGMAKAKHGNGVESTDYTIDVSKSFLKGRLNVKLGGSVSENAEVNKNSTSFLNNLSAEYRLDTAGMFKLRLFGVKDYNNIIEGELMKSGAGILINKTIDRRRDSLDRSLDLEFEGNVVYRSNNQLGPDAAVSFIKNNLFRRNDTFTAKIKGAYYWNLNRKKQKDPESMATYLFGADLALNFPYLQLGEGAKKYIGKTSYRFGYMNENISGDYSANKLYGGIEYGIQQGRYVTHSFSPFYLSIVLADKVSEEYAKNMDLVELLKLFVNNEFIPSIRYGFNFNNYREKNRSVNTALDIQLKESGNIISGIMAAAGRDFNERYKKCLGIEYDQFFKCQLELRNKFNLTDRIQLATRAMAGAVITFGNSVGSPLSEAFYAGGPNSIRAFSPRSIGPGNFYNKSYSSNIFHSGDMKLELNAELRFPIVWKINGAVFVDAGNVWNQRDPREYMSEEDISAMLKAFNLENMYISHITAGNFLNQLALGSGAGLRLDYESIVIRLDLGIAIHAPYDTGMKGYYNIPNFWMDGMRLNFGIGYPF